MSNWVDAIREEWARRKQNSPAESLFPLISQSFDDREIIAAVDTLLDGRITMSREVAAFETRFASFIGAKYAVMVNSGSSANLLAVAAATNPARSCRILPGEEVLVPAVAWPTSIWPWIQHGIKPVFVDVNPQTMNVDPADLRRKVTKNTRAFMAIHVLGNSAPMAELMEIVEEHGLLWIEDTCESLGSRFDGRPLGGFGEFGCYSFYYSHHITTGEGGMVVCHSEEDYDLLKCLRAHGWSRSLSNRTQLEEQYSGIDPRFLFVNLGYNLRPLELQAAFGNCQLDRVEEMNAARNRNRERLIAALEKHRAWNNQLIFPRGAAGTSPAWFGFVCLLAEHHAAQYREYLQHLSSHGIENRPIISGNFIRQPALRLLEIHCRPEDFPGAEEIHRRGFFMGIHTKDLPSSVVDQIADVMLGFRFAG